MLRRTFEKTWKAAESTALLCALWSTSAILNRLVALEARRRLN
jgi:hypothetical protein